MQGSPFANEAEKVFNSTDTEQLVVSKKRKHQTVSRTSREPSFTSPSSSAYAEVPAATGGFGEGCA
jgi:hypothetical protein